MTEAAVVESEWLIVLDEILRRDRRVEVAKRLTNADDVLETENAREAVGIQCRRRIGDLRVRSRSLTKVQTRGLKNSDHRVTIGRIRDEHLSLRPSNENTSQRFLVRTDLQPSASHSQHGVLVRCDVVGELGEDLKRGRDANSERVDEHRSNDGLGLIGCRVHPFASDEIEEASKRTADELEQSGVDGDAVCTSHIQEIEHEARVGSIDGDRKIHEIRPSGDVVNIDDEVETDAKIDASNDGEIQALINDTIRDVISSSVDDIVGAREKRVELLDRAGDLVIQHTDVLRSEVAILEQKNKISLYLGKCHFALNLLQWQQGRGYLWRTRPS